MKTMACIFLIFCLSGCTHIRKELTSSSLMMTGSSCSGDMTAITRKELLILLNMKRRCRRRPEKCRQRIADELARQAITWKRRLAQKNASLDACEEKRRVLLKKRCGLPIKPIIISIAGGVAAGIVGTTIVFILLR